MQNGYAECRTALATNWVDLVRRPSCPLRKDDIPSALLVRAYTLLRIYAELPPGCGGLGPNAGRSPPASSVDPPLPTYPDAQLTSSLVRKDCPWPGRPALCSGLLPQSRSRISSPRCPSVDGRPWPS